MKSRKVLSGPLYLNAPRADILGNSDLPPFFDFLLKCAVGFTEISDWYFSSPKLESRKYLR